MAGENKPPFKIRAKNSKTKEQFDLLVCFNQRGDFEGFDVSPAKDWDKNGPGLGVPKMTITLEYPGGVKRVIKLDPANKASDHYLTLFDNRAPRRNQPAPEGSEEDL